MILSKEQIVHRLSTPYTPQQYGGSERGNRTIVKITITLKNFNPNVEFTQALFVKLVNISYLLCRTGKSSIKNVSNYELWTIYYAHITKQRRRKVNNKATKTYLIGCDGNR